MLSVPVLVYLLKYPTDIATGYSLFIVGTAALIGGLAFINRGDISFESLIQFAIPSLLTVYIVRKFVIPVMPEILYSNGNFQISKQIFIMFLFAFLMLVSSVLMIRKQKKNNRKDIVWEEFAKSPVRIYLVILLAIFVGFITGLVGAGGGFIIIPVLIFFLRVPVKKAIGTSLAIIALNSLIGFTGNFGNFEIDWKFLLSVTLICIAGILFGNLISAKIPAQKLKPAFGWFTLIVGIFVIIKEIQFLK